MAQQSDPTQTLPDVWPLLLAADAIGVRLEVTAGVPMWETSPVRRHQQTIDRIRATITPPPGEGECACVHLADVYIHFPDGSFKRPDISIFCREPDEEDAGHHARAHRCGRGHHRRLRGQRCGVRRGVSPLPIVTVDRLLLDGLSCVRPLVPCIIHPCGHQKAARMLSSRTLNQLPTIEVLNRLCQSLAMLDAIVCPAWEYRYYSYNAHWDSGEAMASMRNGSGDSYFLLFTPTGAILKGFGADAIMSPYRHTPPQVWPGILDKVPVRVRRVSNGTGVCAGGNNVLHLAPTNRYGLAAWSNR